MIVPCAYKFADYSDNCLPFRKKIYDSWKNDCHIHGYNIFLCSTSEYDVAICLLIDLKYNLLILVQPIFVDHSKSDHNCFLAQNYKVAGMVPCYITQTLFISVLVSFSTRSNFLAC